MTPGGAARLGGRHATSPPRIQGRCFSVARGKASRNRVHEKGRSSCPLLHHELGEENFANEIGAEDLVADIHHIHAEKITEGWRLDILDRLK
jgi:hypothetical protein